MCKVRLPESLICSHALMAAALPLRCPDEGLSPAYLGVINRFNYTKTSSDMLDKKKSCRIGRIFDFTFLVSYHSF